MKNYLILILMFNKTITSLLVIFFFFFSFINVVHASPNASDLGKPILLQIENKCQKMPPFLSFPDGFRSPNNFSACEMAFAFNPKRYAYNLNAYQKANVIYGKIFPEFDKNILDKYFLTNLQSQINSKNTLFERAIAGDHYSFYNLINNNYQLSQEEILNLYKFGQHEIIDLLLLSESELKIKINSWKKFEIYLDAYLENIYQLSHRYNNRITISLSKIVQSLASGPSMIEYAFQIPDHLATKVLASLSFSNVIPKNLKLALKLRVFSPQEIQDAFKYEGYRSSEDAFYDRIPKTPEFLYVYYLTNIENLFNGLQFIYNKDIFSLINEVKELERKNINLRKKFSRYFPKTISSGLLKLNTEIIKNIFIDLLEGKKSPSQNSSIEKLLFFNLISYETFYENFSLKIQNKYSLTFDHQKVTKKYHNNIFFQYYYNKLNNLQKYNFFLAKNDNSLTQLAILAKDVDLYCQKLEALQCRKLWSNNVLQKQNLIDLETDLCNPPNKYLPFVRKLINENALSWVYFKKCKIKDFARLFSIDDENVLKKIPKLMYGGGILSPNFIQLNQTLLLEGGGLILSSFHKSNQWKDLLFLPLTTNDFILNFKTSPLAWSFIYEISQNSSPEVNLNKFYEKNNQILNHEALSTFYIKTGQLERALEAQLFSVNKKDKIEGSFEKKLSKVKFILKNLDMPDQFTNDFIQNKLKKHNSNNFLYDKKISKRLNHLQNKIYLGQLGLKNYDFNDNEFSLEQAYDLVNLSITNPKIGLEKICKNSKAGNALFFPKNFLEFDRHMEKAMWNNYATGFQFINFFHKCIYKFYEELENKKSAQKMYDIYQSYVNKNAKRYLDANFDFTDPRNLEIYKFITKASKINKDIFSLTFSIISTNKIYENLVASFVLRDSKALRINQKNMEEIIVNASLALEEIKLNRKDNLFAVQFLENKIKSLKISFKTILASSQKRKRFLSEQNNEHINKLNIHFSNINEQILSTKTIDDYIIKIIEKGNHNIDLKIDPYEGIFRFNNYIKSNNINNIIVSINSNQGDLVVDYVDNNSQKLIIISLDGEDISNIKSNVKNNNNLSSHNAKIACNIFKPLWSKFNFNNKSKIIYIPSVNLFPIPSEIILGTFCQNKEIGIIQASDFSGALKFNNQSKSLQVPKNFIGVGLGNPNPSKITKKINIIKNFLFFRSVNENQKFSPLPAAVVEVKEISKNFKSSKLFLDDNASILNGLLEVQSKYENNNIKSALVLATHGIKSDYARGNYSPGLLSVENKKQILISPLDIEKNNLKGSTVVMSACDTASGFTEEMDSNFTGFVEAFANSGSELLMATLWPVISVVSKETTKSFFKNWNDGELFSAIGISKSLYKENSLPFVYVIP